MSGEATHQNTIIKAIGLGACLTTDELAKQTDLSTKQVSQACGKLVVRGFLDRVEAGCFQLTKEGVMVVESGATLTSAPNHNKQNQRVYKDSMRRRIWSAMRVKEKFTIADITKLAAKGESQARNNVQRYIKVLSQAGLVRRMRKSGREYRFALVVNNGPLAPMIRNHRTEVYDPNTQEVFPCKR